MTIRENYELVKEISQEMAARAIESKAVAAGVATATAAMGLADMQSLASLIATIVGIIVTVILGIKHAFGIWLDYKKSLKDDDDK